MILYIVSQLPQNDSQTTPMGLLHEKAMSVERGRGERNFMALEIGAVLRAIRKKKKINQGTVCHGICGVSTYSQYENGERIPDILSLKMLFERLGYTPKGLNVYASEDSLRFWRWKRELNVLLVHEKYKELAMHLSKMPASNPALNQHLLDSWNR